MKFNIVFLLLLTGIFAKAQKPLSLDSAQKYLQKNNLFLLAEQYNVTIAQAAVIQARIWDQPFLSGEFNAINPQSNRFFDVGEQGQKGLAIQQLIYLGGKKKNEVAFAKSNVSIAELQFEQLLRNLKHQLAQTFYSLHYDMRKVSTVENQIGKLDTLLTNYDIQVKKGNIPLKEVVRLQSLVLTLKNEKNILVRVILEQQQTIALLTGLNEFITPIIDEQKLTSQYQSIKISKDSLFTMVLANNVEYLTAIKISESQELFLRWQKSLATPDLVAGAAYDQRGGAFQNQVNLTFGIPLPLWNRNKGNIKIAEAQLRQSAISKNYKKLQLQTQLESLWQLWVIQQNQLSSLDNSIVLNLDAVYTGMINNFNKRNISLLEFIDFMESYNETNIQINEIKKSWILASLSLNHFTNKEVF